MRDIPADDRPREKMLLRGAAALTDAELLAILLRTGTAEKSALDISSEMTANGGLYNCLAKVTDINELTQIKGLGKAKAATVLAALELGRRLASAKPLEKVHLSGPKQVADYLMPRRRYATKEHFMAVFLNTKNRIIGEEIISEGTLTGSLVHPREVFQPAILRHAAALVVAHNHPSGDPHPSREDRELTAMLYQAGKTLGIPLLDHLVIGDGIYYSFQENGALEI